MRHPNETELRRNIAELTAAINRHERRALDAAQRGDWIAEDTCNRLGVAAERLRDEQRAIMEGRK